MITTRNKDRFFAWLLKQGYHAVQTKGEWEIGRFECSGRDTVIVFTNKGGKVRTMAKDEELVDAYIEGRELPPLEYREAARPCCACGSVPFPTVPSGMKARDGWYQFKCRAPQCSNHMVVAKQGFEATLREWNRIQGVGNQRIYEATMNLSPYKDEPDETSDWLDPRHDHDPYDGRYD